MLGKKLNKIFSSRVFYIVFAVIVAAALWVFVEEDDPRTQRDTIEVQVIRRNEAILSDRNLTITEMTETVSLTFEGTRTGLSQLRPGTVTAEVDLAGITAPGVNIPLDFEVNMPVVAGRMVTELSRAPTQIRLTVDRMYERRIPIRGDYTGGTAQPEYLVGLPEFFPEEIVVFGPESVVSRIDYAWVEIMRENLSSTYIDYLPFILQDVYGHELEEELLDQLAFSHDNVRVTVPVSLMRPVLLEVFLLHGDDITAANIFVDIVPETIYISGDPDAMREKNTIPLGTIDLTRIELLDSFIFSIPVPNSFINESGITEATVRVEIRGLEVWSFSVSNIHTVNVPDDYTLRVINHSLEVRIRGRREELEALTDMNFRITADLTDVGAGQTRVPVTVWIDGDVGNVAPIGDYSITVRLDPIEDSP
ncbi:MAG: hypothetical protein FWC96_00210 [Oscillospiraceae bacterium]|nr:hypothetical protein [Oscillospiraceae bacterium]